MVSAKQSHENRPDDGNMAVGSAHKQPADFEANVPDRTFTLAEVAKHNKAEDLYVVIDSVVYDLTTFQETHPGGKAALLEHAGKDATSAFFGLHRQETLHTPRYARLRIGRIEGAKQLIKKPVAGALSKVPYGEPQWLSPGFKQSPYYTKKHAELALYVRKWVDEKVYPDAQVKELSGKRADQSLMDFMGREDVNLMAMRFGPGRHLQGRTLCEGIIKPEEYSYSFELVVSQELSRIHARGYADGFQSGSIIGLPPLLNFPIANKKLRDEVVEGVFRGKRNISLAITEPYAGSDVQGGIRTTATKTADGKHYIINGAKKWITGSMFADCFTVATRTSKNGLSVFLVEKGEGVEVRPIKTAYSAAAGTGYITFDNVKVPAINLIGEIDQGIKIVLSNFNHERWMMCAASARTSRAAVEECLKWACQRHVFGAPLISQPVIRNRLGTMIAKVEMVQAYLEQITWQMDHMTYAEMSEHLAGPIGFLKAMCTRVADEISSDAVATFGGRGLTQTGMGRHIAHFRATQKFDSVLGGEESVLLDLGVRQALKKMPADARL